MCCAGALFGTTGVSSSTGAADTTAPGVLVNFNVTITDAKVTIVARTIRGQPPGRYVRSGGSEAVFPRGALIRFITKNEGTNAYLPALRYRGEVVRTAQRLAQPGRRVDLNVNFVERGSFLLEALLHRKPHGRPAHIQIY